MMHQSPVLKNLLIKDSGHITASSYDGMRADFNGVLTERRRLRAGVELFDDQGNGGSVCVLYSWDSSYTVMCIPHCCLRDGGAPKVISLSSQNWSARPD